MRRYIIAAGTEKYVDTDELPSVPRDLTEIGAAFAEVGYERAVELLDPKTDILRRALGSWAAEEPRNEDALVVYYTGHGERDSDGHYLLCADSESGGLLDTALRTDDIAAILLRRGIRRLLVIVDTCYAEYGTQQTVRQIAKLLRGDLIPGQHSLDQHPLSFEVIAAARVREPASDGCFARAFRSALRHQEIGGHRQRYLYLQAVVDSINKEFEHKGVLQHATCSIVSYESGFGFLPNPRFSTELPPEGADLAEQRVWLSAQARLRREELVTHFGPRGRGTDIGAEAGHYFVGRVAVLRRLSSWLHESTDNNRAIVVTGSPGAGKSAVLGRLEVLANPATRDTIPPNTVQTGTDPGVGSINVTIHARHKTMDDLVAGIAAGAGDSNVETVDELVNELAARTEPLVVLVDALDEAGTANDSESARIAIELLRRLAQLACVRLLVGTRRHVVPACGPDFLVLDLDEQQWVERKDLADYAEQLLLAPHGLGSKSVYDATTAPPIAEGIAEAAYPNYLVTRLTARALAARNSVVKALPAWQGELPAPEPEITKRPGSAFRWALAEQLGTDERRARQLLTPLAFAEGAGLPWGEVWPAVASSISRRRVDTADIEWLLASCSSHVVEALDELHRSVYRLYHESFVDQLRIDAPDNTEQHVVDALIGLVPPSTGHPGRDWLAADPYVRTHLATHAANCGRLDEPVLDPAFLLAAERGPLLRAMNTVRAKDARLACTAYERCVHLLGQNLPFGEQASILHLSALQVNAHALIAALSASPEMPWRAQWSEERSGPHPRHISLHKCRVTAVAHTDLAGMPSLVTGDAVGDIHVWKLSTGEKTHQLRGVNNTAIIGIATLSTTDGQLVVTLHADGNLAGWYPLTGQRTGNPITAIFRYPLYRMAGTVVDGDPVVAVTAQGHVRVWNLRTRKLLFQRRVVHYSLGLQGMAFVDWDGRAALVCTTTMLPRLFGTSRWRKALFRAVVFTLDGKRVEHRRNKDVAAIGIGEVHGKPTIITEHKDGRAADCQSRSQLAEIRLTGSFRLHMFDSITSTLIRHADRQLLAHYNAGRLELWDLHDCQQHSAIPMADFGGYQHTAPVAFEMDGTTWLAVLAGRSVIVIDISRQALSPSASSIPVTSLVLDFRHNPPAVICSVGAGYFNSRVLGYELESGVPISLTDVSRDALAVFGGGLAEQPKPVFLATMSYDYSADKQVIIQRIDIPEDQWRCSVPKNRLFEGYYLVGEGDQLVVVMLAHDWVAYRFWPTGPERSFNFPFNYAVNALSVDGRTMLFILDFFKRIRAIDLVTTEKIWSHPIEGESWHSILYAGWIGAQPVVVAVSANHSIFFFDARTGESIGPPLVGHVLAPNALILGAAHGQLLLASGGEDQTVRIWWLSSMRQVALIDVGSVVTALALTPGGVVVVGTKNSIIQIALSPALFDQ